MKLGVTPWDFSDRTAAGLSAQAAQAEALGYESFWLPENHFNPSAIPDPLMLLAAVAAATSSIRLATTSYLLPLRNPLQAAEQVAVLDQLCSGRVTLGIGRGYAPSMLKAFDVRPSEKRERFERCLDIMRLAWSGAEVPLDYGEESSGEAGESIRLDPLPVQRPHPPLWVAAFGPKALAQAGRLGLPYLASPMETMDTLTSNYARHSVAAIDAGHVVNPTVPVMRTVFVATSNRQAEEIRDRLDGEAVKSGRLAEGANAQDWTIVGDEGYVRDKIAEYREQLQVSHLIVTRLRISGVDRHLVRTSMEKITSLVG